MADKELEIKKYMNSLDISYEEAKQLWEDDQEDFIGDAGEEMTVKAKEVMRTIHDARTFDKNKPKVERVRKENPTKRTIIQALSDTVGEIAENVKITNIEKYISFQMNGEEYEINLIQKRKKKS